jgi:hypothetical protein
MLPSLNELRERMQWYGLDLFSKTRERAPSRSFSDSARTPLRRADVGSEATPHERSSALPFSEPFLDPSIIESVTLRDLIDRYGARQRDKSGEYLSSRGGTRDDRRAKRFRYELTRFCECVFSKCGYVARECFRQYVSSLCRSRSPKGYLDCASAIDQFSKWVPPNSLPGRCNPFDELRIVEIAGAIEEIREIVDAPGFPASSSPGSLIHDLPDRFERQLVACCFSHYFAEQ